MTYEELMCNLSSPDFDESQFVDFKSEVPDGNVADLAKDISSFANSMGGRIFIGINNDKTINDSNLRFPVSRWSSMNAEQLSNATRSKISKFLSHGLQFKITPINIPHKDYPVLLIDIFKSEIICGYRQAIDKSFEFWIRLDRQNSPMGISQIIDKTLGAHYHREQLLISMEFAELLMRRVAMICVAVHQAYGNLVADGYKIVELINENKINEINRSKGMIVLEAEKTYANLASLAFLSANIGTELKQLMISLLNKISKIIARDSIWRIEDNVLVELKGRPIESQLDLRMLYFNESNDLIKDFQIFINIKEEIGRKIAQLEAADLISFGAALDPIQMQ